LLLQALWREHDFRFSTRTFRWNCDRVEEDYGMAIAVDANGDMYIAGREPTVFLTGCAGTGGPGSTSCPTM
jgi:hypothetical protein